MTGAGPWKIDRVTGAVTSPSCIGPVTLSPGHLVIGTALGRAAEGGQLVRGEPAGLADGEFAEVHGAEGEAAQAEDLVAQAGEHAADLAVLALVQDHLQPGTLALP